MSKQTLKNIGIALGALLIASPATAGSITFSDMRHGEVLDPNRYAGVTIDVHNLDENFELGVAFDSSLTGTRDTDLEAPWTTGNLAGPTDLGRVLIVQENQTGCDDGICDHPDDEGSRPAGTISMHFDDPLAAFSLDLIDVDEATAERGWLEFFSGNTHVKTVLWSDLDGVNVPGAGVVAYGDNSANRLPVFTAADLGVASFDKVFARMGGSGAIDNLRWASAAKPVPEPSAALVFGLGLAIVGARRRP